MGVWHRGKATRMSALNYLHEYRQALPDVTDADVPGSAYAIRDYQVEHEVGGRDGLASFREELRRLGIRADPRLRAQSRRHRPWLDIRASGLLC